MSDLYWLDEDWDPSIVTHHTNRKGRIEELSHEGYDDREAKQMGYRDVKHLNAHNYNKDKLCKIKYGINCKRNT